MDLTWILVYHSKMNGMNSRGNGAKPEWRVATDSRQNTILMLYYHRCGFTTEVGYFVSLDDT